MRSPLYVDEYGLVDTSYLVHASPFNPCGEDDCEPQSWFIGLLFHVGTKAHHATLVYPTRAHRNQAFETLCAHATAVQRAAGD